ncbi:hypothetical protein [Methyloceanibacter sp.]|uniref:hypothetical protein n=1 Tax=Methyloceanibacter sp. TaxID=1965321 RepID=UPI002D2BF613|nr:hypothetical protein [Methyloceanibacter sp.]HZP10411.1 hypothetical protein [Methyloceanibacter sp.]
MTKRGSSQFLLLFLRPSAKLGWKIGGAAALVALAAVAIAGFAPALQESAWQQALAGEPSQAWPWEATHPAKDSGVPRLGLSAAVNEETVPQVEIAPAPARTGKSVERSRLELGDVAIGDRITVTTADGASRDYRVTGRKVVGDPHLAEGDSTAPTGGEVSPVTCWSRDLIAGTLRLIIEATGVDQPRDTHPSAEQKL